MNNKGFAVTAVIYGLSILGVLIITILMGTLSASRANIQLEAKKIERDLIAFNRSSVIYTQGRNIFTVPEGETGWYRIEAFGSSSTTMMGAYTTGIIFLNERTSLGIDLEAAEGTEVKVGGINGTLIMRAAAATPTNPGGTLKGYSAEPLGGLLDNTTFLVKDAETTNNIIGSQSVTYGAGRISSIAGYPGSMGAQGGYYFVDGFMLASANHGSAKAIITRLARKDDEVQSIPRVNTDFNNLSSLKIINNSGVNITNIYVGAGGNITQTTPSGIETNINLGGVNVDDISVLFDTTDNKYVKNVKILGYSGSQERQIYNSESESAGFTVTPTGIKLSAYQLKTNTNPPRYGNYYLIPVLTSNKVVSARRNSESEDNPIGVEYINGQPRQRWSITRITSNNVLKHPDDIEYYLSEGSRFKAMSIYHDENTRGNRILATMSFNTLSRNIPQIWKIDPIQDGTFSIKTVRSSYNQTLKSGFLAINTARKDDNTATDYFEQLMIGQVLNTGFDIPDSDTIPTNTERFYLYNLDFGNSYK